MISLFLQALRKPSGHSNHHRNTPLNRNSSFCNPMSIAKESIFFTTNFPSPSEPKAPDPHGILLLPREQRDFKTTRHYQTSHKKERKKGSHRAHDCLPGRRLSVHQILHVMHAHALGTGTPSQKNRTLHEGLAAMICNPLILDRSNNDPHPHSQHTENLATFFSKTKL